MKKDEDEGESSGSNRRDVGTDSIHRASHSVKAKRADVESVCNSPRCNPSCYSDLHLLFTTGHDAGASMIGQNTDWGSDSSMGALVNYITKPKVVRPSSDIMHVAWSAMQGLERTRGNTGPDRL